MDTDLGFPLFLKKAARNPGDRKLLTNRLIGKLRDANCSEQSRAGSRVTINELCRRFNVSRTSLRALVTPGRRCGAAVIEHFAQVSLARARTIQARAICPNPICGSGDRAVNRHHRTSKTSMTAYDSANDKRVKVTSRTPPALREFRRGSVTALIRGRPPPARPPRERLASV